MFVPFVPKLPQVEPQVVPLGLQVGGLRGILGPSWAPNPPKSEEKTTPKKHTKKALNINQTRRKKNLTDKGTGSAIKWKFEDTRRHMEKT